METRLTEPRFFGTRTTASIGVFNEELTEFNQPFGTRTTGGSLGFGRDWGKHVMTALSFSLEKRDQFSVEVRPTSQAEEETRTIFVTTPYIRYDSRDSFVRPTKGLYSSLSVDISKGIQNRLDDFLRYQFDTRYYRTPVEGITLAGLARIGQVLPYSDSRQYRGPRGRKDGRGRQPGGPHRIGDESGADHLLRHRQRPGRPGGRRFGPVPFIRGARLALHHSHRPYGPALRPQAGPGGRRISWSVPSVHRI
ncbi:MAG: BamA/TamA family outer membrane protein [Desulfosarcina sp.]|nr:BamA/TamA family outer membrane protein [Desulfosarcina sp.]